MNPTIVQRTEEDGVMKFTINQINTSFANAIRRIILSEIDCFVFKTSPYEQNKCTIHVNTSRLNNEIIKQRLSSIPINIKDSDFPIADYILEVNVKNDSDVIKIVTTEDFKIKNIHTGQYISQQQVHRIFPPNIISGDYIDFVRLRPKISDDIDGEHIKLECAFDIGNSKQDGTFNVVSCCSYGATPDPVEINSQWSIKQSQLASEGVTPEEIAYAKKDWYNLEAQRYYIKDSYDFTIETVGIYENIELVRKACLIMIKKFQKLAESLQTNPGLIADLNDNTLYMAFEIILEKEDYTLGKALECILYEKFFYPLTENGPLSYCGFRKPHPHIDISLIRIAFVYQEPSRPDSRSDSRTHSGGAGDSASAAENESGSKSSTRQSGDDKLFYNEYRQKVLSIVLQSIDIGVEVFTKIYEDFK